jgi:uncharacterized protein YjbI with pentapeptide repeats
MDHNAALHSVNNAARQASGALFFLGLYYITCAAIISRTSHVDVLFARPIELAIHSFSVPFIGFFRIGPWILVILHANLLVLLTLVIKKAAIFEDILESLNYPQRTFLRSQLEISLFAQFVGGTKSGGTGKFINAFVWVSTGLFPLLTLAGFLVCFLPYQDDRISWCQRAAIFIDALLIVLFWTRVIQSRRFNKLPLGYRLPLWRMLTFWNGLLLVISITVIFGSFFVFVVPLSSWELFISRCRGSNVDAQIANATANESLRDTESAPRNCTTYLTYYFLDRPKSVWKRHLVVENSVVVVGDLSVEERYALRKSASDLAAWEGVKDKFYSFDGTGRSFVFADFRGSFFPKAIFADANMVGVNFGGAFLREANLYRAQGQASNFGEANLVLVKAEDSNLTGAHLNGAKISGAIFANANLHLSDLFLAEGAEVDFYGANLIGANLGQSLLPGASFVNSDLIGADLGRSEIQGANFYQANLQGASLIGAQIQGALVPGANFRGTDLSQSNLKGVVFFDANWISNRIPFFEMADLSEASFEWEGTDYMQTLSGYETLMKDIGRPAERGVLNRLKDASDDLTHQRDVPVGTESCLRSRNDMSAPWPFKYCETTDNSKWYRRWAKEVVEDAYCHISIYSSLIRYRRSRHAEILKTRMVGFLADELPFDPLFIRGAVSSKLYRALYLQLMLETHSQKGNDGCEAAKELANALNPGLNLNIAVVDRVCDEANYKFAEDLLRHHGAEITQ